MQPWPTPMRTTTMKRTTSIADLPIVVTACGVARQGSWSARPPLWSGTPGVWSGTPADLIETTQKLRQRFIKETTRRSSGCAGSLFLFFRTNIRIVRRNALIRTTRTRSSAKFQAGDVKKKTALDANATNSKRGAELEKQVGDLLLERQLLLRSAQNLFRRAHGIPATLAATSVHNRLWPLPSARAPGTDPVPGAAPDAQASAFHSRRSGVGSSAICTEATVPRTSTEPRSAANEPVGSTTHLED